MSSGISLGKRDFRKLKGQQIIAASPMSAPRPAAEPTQKRWYEGRSRSFWLVIALIVVLNILYDIYSFPRGVILDAIILIVALFRYGKIK